MRLAPVAVALLLIAASACGSDETASTPRVQAKAPTLRSLWKRPGQDVALVMGTSDYAPGLVRVSFLVVARNGRAIDRPRARVWLARSLQAAPFASGYAEREPVGVPGGYHDDHDVTHLYVARLRVPAKGKYWLVARPEGGPRIQGLGTLLVKAKTTTPSVGERAPASATPTLTDAGGRPERVTTRTPPDVELVRWSVAESIAARKPFVVVFATPKFCTSRTCGPVVDVVDAVRRRVGKSDVRFIHVEIYEGLNPANGPNRWVREWNLPNEPWTFLVGRNGRIRAKFEGSLSVEELETAVRGTLLR